MCGISGLVDFNGNQIDENVISSMTNILAHRGPDDSGIYCKSNVALGHRRLSIIDLSALGHQPMATPDGRILIVFNGEIYNYQELRSDLLKSGHSFVSNTDTEVILHGYREWGQECWKRLDGMFSIGLWDTQTSALTLVRDPFGIKPLFYAYNQNRVIFSSEIKGLLASGYITPRVNFESLSNYLTYFYTPGPETIVEGIEQVEPGRAMTFRNSEVRTNRYWKINPEAQLVNVRPNDLIAQVRHECNVAVNKSLVSDVPVGLLLSSGVDSNIILNEIVASGAREIETVTVGFRESSYNETDLVKRRVGELGVKSHVIYVEDHSLTSTFDKMVYHMDSLSANVAGMAEYLIVKAVSEKVKVALAGAGNDELFAGYATYIADKILPYYKIIPAFARSGVRMLADHIPHSGKKYSYDYLIRKFTEGAEYTPDKSHYWWRTIFTDKDKMMMSADASGENALMTDSFRSYKKYYDEVGEKYDFATQSLYADFFMFCNQNANMMVDNLSMAFSLEIRPPFLTKRFVEFAFSVPYKYKLNGLTTKYILRKAYEGLIPDYILKQKKSGLVSPIPQLIRGQLREFIQDNFNSLSDHPYFNKAYLTQMLKEHLSGERDHGFKLYTILTYLRWHDMFIKNTAPMDRIL